MPFKLKATRVSCVLSTAVGDLQSMCIDIYSSKLSQGRVKDDDISEVLKEDAPTSSQPVYDMQSKQTFITLHAAAPRRSY